MFPRALLVAGVMVCAFPGAGCGDSSSNSRFGQDGGGGGSPPSGSDCLALPKVRGPSESCCPAHGADACGANLFCAALDGRTIATCYALRSQLPGKECTADEQCLSGACHPQSRRCLGVAGGPCVEDAGCVDSVCHQDRCELSAGVAGAICDRSEQCKDGMTCTAGRCGTPNGGSCTLGEDFACASRLCQVPEHLNYGNCGACTQDSDCTTAWNSRFEICDNGRCVRTCRTQEHCDVLRVTSGACGSVVSGCVAPVCQTEGARHLCR